jgi:hypothetical protein
MQVEEGAKMHGQVTVGAAVEGASQVAQPPTHGGGGKAEGEAEPKASEEVEPEPEPKASEEVEPEPEAKASEKVQAKPEPKASEEAKPGRRSEALGEVAPDAEELEAVQQEHSRD